MNNNNTFMAKEIAEIPIVLQNLYKNTSQDIKEVADKLKQYDPSLIITVARGSSDHVATYLKYAIETVAGVPVASLGPSIASIYDCSLNLKKTAAFVISQSGKSPDIIKSAQMIEKSSGFLIGFTNMDDTPIYDICNHTINITAGIERSVAATKTYIASVVSGLLLLGFWKNDKKLLKALNKLPEQLEQAMSMDWSSFIEQIANNDDKSPILVLGRGLSYGVTLEAALKLKEVCQLHAEAFSGAEVLHGPVSVVNNKYPILMFAPQDKTRQSMERLSEKLINITPSVFMTNSHNKDIFNLPYIKTNHPLTEPLSILISFYIMVEALAKKLNLNPDKPPLLNKITRTF